MQLKANGTRESTLGPHGTFDQIVDSVNRWIDYSFPSLFCFLPASSAFCFLSASSDFFNRV